VSKISLKNFFLCLLQLPVSLALFLCAFAEKYFTDWMIALENPLSHPMTELATKRAKDEQGTANTEKGETPAAAGKIITQDRYRAFDAYLLSRSDYSIDRLRFHLEAKYAGLMAEGRRRDPHLYAVLKPTRNENLVRIGNVFGALTPTTQAAIITTALAIKECGRRP
jgi:hypothetical protein